MKWVVSTQNRDKLREIRAALSDLPVTLVDLSQFPRIGAVEETGTSLQENALLKAETIHRFTGLPAIADDTGLEVDALDGAPGVYSARFAGQDATYAGNQQRLLEALKGVPADARTARFRTVAVLVDSGERIVAEGEIGGRIAASPRGANGFGYDPIFIPEGSDLTFGQMTSEAKQEISHRTQAFAALSARLVHRFPRTTDKETAA